MRIVVCLFVCLFTHAASSEAATRTVCASGCQYTSLQAAIDAAVAGDTILLRAGETFIGNVTLRPKSGTAFITIKSDAPATSLPGEGVRLVPEGKPGANTARRALARLLGRTGTYKSVPIVRAAPGAHHYRLQFLEIDGTNSVGYDTLVALGDNNSTQTRLDAVPYSIVLDRVWVHGHPTKGVKRGIGLNSRSTDILNSYINDVFSLPDSQAIAGYNGPGPFRIVNNHLEASAENIMFGGADPKIANLVPSDIEIRDNLLTKKLAWRTAVLATPSKPTAKATTGGALPAGTHYFRVSAALVAGADTVQSAGSLEVAATVGASGAVQLSWPAVAGAEKYRVFRGTSAGGQAFYVETTANSFKYTGTAEKSGKPLTSGRRWTAKNLLELKSAQRVVIDGNVFEHNWSGFQDGTAVLFTPRNQENTAPWTVVRDITFSNNTVRDVGNAITILGEDYNNPSLQTRDIRIVNNVFHRVGGDWGAGKFLILTSGSANITVDHNTIDHDGSVVVTSGPATPGFVFTNNFLRHNRYGIYGQNKASGLSTLNYYFPGHVVTGNVLAGGKSTSYPTGNYFPPAADFLTSFVNAALGNFTLVATSPYNNKAIDGKDIGVDFGALTQAQAGGSVGGTVVPTDPAPTPAPQPAPETYLLPTGWQAQDIGAVGAAGSTTYTSGVFTVMGEGKDIWNAADEFHFASTALDGDGSIVARVKGLSGVDAWTKAGVMIRATTAAGSVHGFMLVSKGKGLAFQRRTSTGSLSVHTSGGTGTAPYWVKLTRAGNVVSAYKSTTGTSWTLVGRQTLPLPTSARIGLAVTGRNHLATAFFDNVTVVR